MKTYYRANEINKKNILLNWRNGQAIWKNGSKVLMLLSIICIAICIGIYVILTNMVKELDKTSSVSIEFIAIMLAVTFGMISAVILVFWFRKVHFKAMEPYYRQANECIYLKEDRLVVIAHDIFSEEAESVDEFSMSYNNIRDIQLNEIYRELTITGQTDRTYYNDYSLGKAGKQWPTVKDGKIKLLLYYDDENMFLEGLTEKTGLHIKQISKA